MSISLVYNDRVFWKRLVPQVGKLPYPLIFGRIATHRDNAALGFRVNIFR